MISQRLSYTVIAIDVATLVRTAGLRRKVTTETLLRIGIIRLWSWVL